MTQPSLLSQKGMDTYGKKDKEQDAEHTTKVVDPKFLERTGKKFTFPGKKDVFLVASFTEIVVELSAALFTLSVIHFKLSRGTVHKVTLGYYAVLAVLVTILMADSISSLIEANADRREGKIGRKEMSLKRVGYVSTVISATLWLFLCAASVAMENGYSWHALVMTTLVVSIVAPLIGMVSAFVRALEVLVSTREREGRALLEASSKKLSVPLGDSAANDLSKVSEGSSKIVPGDAHLSGVGKAKASSLRQRVAMCLRSSMFMVIAIFEAAHCLCHMYEAYLLLGKTNQLFLITEKVLLYTQAAIAVVFLVLFVAEHAIQENKGVAQGAKLGALPNDVAGPSVWRSNNTVDKNGATHHVSSASVGLSVAPVSVSIDGTSVQSIMAEMCCSGALAAAV